jgi:hypothetical protein
VEKARAGNVDWCVLTNGNGIDRLKRLCIETYQRVIRGLKERYDCTMRGDRQTGEELL